MLLRPQELLSRCSALSGFQPPRSASAELAESRSRGLKAAVDFTLPFGCGWWRWAAASRGEAEGATVISSCTRVRFLSALRF